jgi:hypothetical protein
MPTIEGRLLGEPDAVAAVASVPEPEPEPQNEAASRPALKRAASRPSGAVRPSRRVQHRPVPLPPAHPARVFAGGARAIAWAH